MFRGSSQHIVERTQRVHNLLSPYFHGHGGRGITLISESSVAYLKNVHNLFKTMKKDIAGKMDEKIWVVTYPYTKSREIRCYKSGWLKAFEFSEAVYLSSKDGKVAGKSAGNRGGGFVGFYLCTDKEMAKMQNNYEKLYDLLKNLPDSTPELNTI